MFPSPLGVIFSLINLVEAIQVTKENSFRLLSELYSLLLEDYQKIVQLPKFKESFRLLSELYSLLYKSRKF